MEKVQHWAIRRWEEDTKKKLCAGNVGSKVWWKIIRDKQGTARDETIHPLNLPNDSLAISTHEKVNALAQPFASKINMKNPLHQPHSCH